LVPVKAKRKSTRNAQGNQTRSERNIAWLQRHIKIPEGQFVGQKFKMAEYMRKDFAAIYDNPYGTRRAIISRGRKNAKTFEAAIIMLLHLCGKEFKANSQIFSVAQSRDQAALIFNLAVKMINQDETLKNSIIIRESSKQLICPVAGTTYKALSAESSTALGLNPAVILMDELGQVRGPRSALFEAMELATAAQKEPLTVIISTQAPSSADLLSILIDDAKAAHDPRTVLRFDTAFPELNPFSTEAIRAANPAFDIFMNQQEVLSMAENAKRMPARQADWECYALNRRVEINNPFVSPEAWRVCGNPPQNLHNVSVWGGLDLSAVSDLTAFVLIGQAPPGSRCWSVLPTFWLPGQDLAEKSQKDRVPYDMWAKDGFLQTTPGATVAYEYVAQYLKNNIFSGQYNVEKIGFDRWNFKHLKPWLIHAGLSEQFIDAHFVEIGMGTQTMSPALRDLEQAVLDKRLAHGDHPVLNMNAACAVIESKDESNRKLSKNRSTGRIDGLVALACAFAVAPMGAQVIDVEALIG
jgi:phage terminase large subunit-like protein